MSTQDQPQKSAELPPPVVLMQLLTGFQVTQAVSVAAQLGIADCLVEGPKSSEELARATETHPRSLHRLMCALVSVGMFAETEDGRFELTPLGSYLQADKPDSLRAIALMDGEDYQWRAWSSLLHSIKTGAAAFDYVFGKNLFEHLATHPQSRANFDAAMTDLATQRAATVPAAYEFSQFTKVVDVGGGQGRLLTAVLKPVPTLKGVLFDLPDAVARAKQVVAAEGLANRCECVAGDFFESVPRGGDAYTLSEVIHDWPDEQARTILQNCRQAMAVQGKLLLIERVMPARTVQSVTLQSTTLMDLTMLVMLGAQERTESEYRSLLASAGFTLTTITPTSSPYSIVEAVPA